MPSEGFMLGCKAYVGQSVQQLSKESQKSRTWIYRQAEKVSEYAQSLDTNGQEEEQVAITKQLKTRLVVSMALDCRAPLEGIQRTMAVLGVKISIGAISGILQEAANRAEEFDKSVPLDGISQGANDEIFQGSTPILTGIDLDSTYVYLLEAAKDRSGDTWQLYMEDCKERGLQLDVNISDGGTGLQAGIPAAFPGIVMQPDIFHALRPIGKEVAAAERRAYQLLSNVLELEKRTQGKCPRKSTREQLTQVREKEAQATRTYDILAILYAWLKELLGWSGYPYGQALDMVQWILSEMEFATPGRDKFHRELQKFGRSLPQILLFLKRMEEQCILSSQKTGVPLEAYHLIYQEKSCAPLSQMRSQIEYALGNLLGSSYASAKEECKRLLSSIQRASSLVENLNGRIRPYIDLKRTIPDKFFVLLKVYFNTRKYRRSRHSERVGKSPMELLTGREQPGFWEALGF